MREIYTLGKLNAENYSDRLFRGKKFRASVERWLLCRRERNGEILKQIILLLTLMNFRFRANTATNRSGSVEVARDSLSQSDCARENNTTVYIRSRS